MSIKNRLTSLLQLIIVLLYIVFEELIWEGIAKPIYQAIHSLKILQKLETKLEQTNAHVILFIFVILLFIVEVVGIYASILFISGQALLGVILYLSKIPVAAFTFWLFRATETKLMQFKWFEWLYNKLMKAIEWVKSSEMYQKTIAYIRQVKVAVKSLKEKYFTEQSPFVEKIKLLYKNIKESLQK